MKNIIKGLVIGLLAITAGLAVGFGGLVWNGFVFAKIWAWFVPLAFPAATVSINWATGAGLDLLFNLFMGYGIARTYFKEGDDHRTITIKLLSVLFIVPLVFLGCGWIIHLFV